MSRYRARNGLTIYGLPHFSTQILVFLLLYIKVRGRLESGNRPGMYILLFALESIVQFHESWVPIMLNKRRSVNKTCYYEEYFLREWIRKKWRLFLLQNCFHIVSFLLPKFLLDFIFESLAYLCLIIIFNYNKFFYINMWTNG